MKFLPIWGTVVIAFSVFAANAKNENVDEFEKIKIYIMTVAD